MSTIAWDSASLDIVVRGSCCTSISLIGCFFFELLDLSDIEYNLLGWSFSPRSKIFSLWDTFSYCFFLTFVTMVPGEEIIRHNDIKTRNKIVYIKAMDNP